MVTRKTVQLNARARPFPLLLTSVVMREHYVPSTALKERFGIRLKVLNLSAAHWFKP